MGIYLVESSDWQILHQGVMSDGALGKDGGAESIYLHVLAIDDDTIRKLVPRVDVDGNRQSDRLALAGNEEWWIPLEGRKAWPKTVNPKVTSGCKMGEDGVPRARALSASAIATLKKLGAKVPD
jgi:hypothetical protein